MRGYSRPAPAPCPQGTQAGCSPALCVALCWRLDLPLPSICELVFISPEAPFLGVDVGEGRETPNPPGHHGQTQPPASPASPTRKQALSSNLSHTLSSPPALPPALLCLAGSLSGSPGLISQLLSAQPVLLVLPHTALLSLAGAALALHTVTDLFLGVFNPLSWELLGAGAGPPLFLFPWSPAQRLFFVVVGPGWGG